MIPVFRQLGKRGAAFWAGFSSGQRVVSILLTAAVLVGGFGVYSLLSKPDYGVLFGGLSGTEAQAVVDQLTTAGVPYQLTDGGTTILVPRDSVYAQRIAAASKGLASGSSGKGWSLLDNQGLTTSDFQQQVAYQRAMQDELAKTIQAIDGVQTAVVNLAIPKKDVFATSTDVPTASVLVKTIAGRDLGSDQVQAITNLVANSVPSLKPENVTVADATGKVLSAAGADGVSGALADNRSKATKAFEDYQAASLTSMLSNLVGAGKVAVKVSAELDFNKTVQQSEVYAYDKNNPAKSSTSTTENYKGSGAAVGGVLGPDNIAVPSGTNGNTTYTKGSITQDNTLNKVVQETTKAPGTVSRMSVAVLLDSTAAASLNMAQINQMVKDAIGLDSTNTRNSVTVTRMPFNTTAAAEAQKALDAAAAAAKTATYIDYGKTAAQVLGVLLVLLLIRRRLRKAMRGGLSAKENAELDEVRRQLALSQGQLRDIEASKLRAQLEPSVQTLEAGERQTVLRDIERLVDSEPDQAAQLIRSWMAEK